MNSKYRKWIYMIFIISLLGLVVGITSGHCKLCSALTPRTEAG